MQSKILTSVSYKAPSDLPKSGGAAAPPAPPFAAPLYCTENWEASFCIQISTALYTKMKENLAFE